MAESLREDTFLKESLPIVILRIVGILGFEPILSFSLSSKEDKAIALEETFLDAKETETLLEEHFAIQQVWDLFLKCTYLLALELALENKSDESGNSPTYWELSWRSRESIRFFNNLFGFIELMSGIVHTGGKSPQYRLRDVQTCLNDLGFSLCVTLPICHMVATSDNRKKSEIGVSTDLVCCYWTLGIEFNKSLSLLIIRLVNYSVTTSLIYKFLL